MQIITQLDHGKRTCMIEIQGAFDVSLSSELLPVLRNLPFTVREVMFDLLRTTSLDATAIASLVMFYSELGPGKGIRIINCSERVARVLVISGVSRLMQVCMADSSPVEEGAFQSRMVDRQLFEANV